jgi:phospholipid/cholesterol/gamma-HCH transport system substrate-binding protein
VAGLRLPFKVRRRLLGLLYIVTVIALIGLSIAMYNKAFTDTVTVTLKTDHTGNSLLISSDVKERGIIVGSVDDVHSSGDGAIVTLSLSPGRVSQIPSNVTAQILPKTLFGEQYVALQIPESPSDQAIEEGDVIEQDRSASALEAQKVLGDLLPLLQALRPAELNATLTNVAAALAGRGEKLGETLQNLDDLLTRFNPHTERLVDDLTKLGENADLYNEVAPQLFHTLDNLRTTSKTITENSAGLDDLLTTATNTAGVLQSFLADNKTRLIRLVGSSDSIARLLDRYQSEDVCLVNGIAHLYDLTSSIFHNHQVNLSAVLDLTNMGGYKAGEEPRLVTGLGPHCFGLPYPREPFLIPDDFRCFNDGAALTRDPCAQKPNYVKSRALNSPAEKIVVNSVLAQPLGTTPNNVPAAATVLAAPLLRGGSVVVK